ncbi:hypothetical protein J2T60_000882 [Natronospira proteinivora]|uniref:Uncharacterized AAA domain-containing protein ycf46 n=1 Tax=Natronospira proteinivora TaxID=1807133 RepID=A0ABT1G6J0_9GAMM|nr:AAA family ATPase [Natronospira proteinivora]MCP1726917.1 hypothetical protein [Natronospira proteinivora]
MSQSAVKPPVGSLKADKHELAVQLRAGNGLITMETRDELRAEQLFRHTLREVFRPLFRWTAAGGLERLDMDAPVDDDVNSPEAVLRYIRDRQEPGVFLLMDFHPYLDNPIHVRLLREVARAASPGAPNVVMISPELDLPRELQPLAVPFDLSVPTEEELEYMVREEGQAWAEHNHGQRVKASRRALNLLINNLRGLPMKDARRLARNAIWNDGALTEKDLPDVMEAKFRMLDPGGVLSFEMETESFAQVAGLSRLKDWLNQRAPIFAKGEPPPGLDMPRGILLLGVQGCGKSLAARAVAGVFGVPLLRLDCGALYNKYHGESERNLRESLASAELMAPCVLWLDEIEKGMSVSDTDGGTSQRMLGSFLTWMAERGKPVFLVATANDIEKLPPEMVRQGRFDEIFFVDLPSRSVRQSVIAIHLQRRELDPDDYDLDRLADVSEGYSGAELEQAVVSACYAAYANGGAPDSEGIRKAIADTRPLSVVRRESIESLRAWAAERTVPAD